MATPTASYVPILNAFTGTIVEKLARQLWSSKSYQNKLAFFKKGFIENANEIEEIYVSRIQSVAQDFDGSTTLDKVAPDVKTQYHKQEYGKLYTTTVSDKQARRAFWKMGGVKKLADEQLKALETGVQYDEYVAFKGAIDTVIANAPATSRISVTAVTDNASAKELTKKVQATVEKMTFRSTDYATYESNSMVSDLAFITTPDVKAELNVELLATAFNMEKAEIPLRIITVDSFADSGVQGVIMDANALQLYDTLYNMETQRNAQGMFTNYHLNVEKIVSTSNLYNVAYFDATV